MQHVPPDSVSPYGRALAAAGVAVLAVTLSACGSSSKKSAKPAPSSPVTTPSTTPPRPGTTARPSASARVSVRATPTPAPGPAFTPGSLKTVAPVAVRTQPAVAPNAVGTFGDGVTVRIVKTASVTSNGSGPGEIRGEPSIALTIRLTNGTSRSVSLQSVAVSVTYGSDATPASPVDGSPSAPFTGSVAAGRSADGVYVFAVPVNQRGDVSVTMSYAAGKPTVLFHGAVG